MGKRVYSLCSSEVVSRAAGYFQYRASSRSTLTFAYPAEKKPPLGFFRYHASANGDASIEFTNDGHHYVLVDPLRQGSSLHVSAPAGAGRAVEISCGPNQTLQVNYTMRLMYDAGVWARD